MILADKIIENRKKNGWSQEDLASKLGVSRQAISKWEGAQSTPDLNKILAMSRLFGVTTDYLIKDEIVRSDEADLPDDDLPPVRILSLAETNEFLTAKQTSSREIALGVFLCILAMFPLILTDYWPDVDYADSVAFICTVLIAAGAVGLFMHNYFRMQKFNWLKKEDFEGAYGTEGLIRERAAAFRPTYSAWIILGVTLCILGFVGLVASSFLPRLTSISEPTMLGISWLIIACAVYLLVRANVQNNGFDCLLEKGEYSREKKKGAVSADRYADRLGAIFWPAITAIYLGYSFLTSRWDRSWIIWPVGSLIFVTLCALPSFLSNRSKK